MKKIHEITDEDIKNMSYNELIGIIKETNRIPGGKNTIFEIINRVHLSRESKVLEIGTSTGFTAIEISRFVKCSITAIDINEESLNEAKNRASKEDMDNIIFLKADVNNLPFKDNEFDLVIVGNIFSLMTDKEKSINECKRVCKKEGFIIAVPMYYIKQPSNNLVEKVSEAIKVNIKPLYKSDWINFFNNPTLEIYWSKDFKFDFIPDETIRSFVEEILDRPHLKNLKEETSKKLKEIYTNYMFLFRDNLSHMGFTIFLISNKRIWEDLELFTSQEIK